MASDGARPRLVAWSLLTATTLLLASLSEAVFARATAQAETAAATSAVTPATAALGDGDDLRARTLIEQTQQRAAQTADPSR